MKEIKFEKPECTNPTTIMIPPAVGACLREQGYDTDEKILKLVCEIIHCPVSYPCFYEQGCFLS
jgi:hypothetical protein